MTGAALCAAMIAVLNPPADRAESFCQHADYLIQQAQTYQVSPEVLVAVAWKESRFNPTVENHGCCGLMGTNSRYVPETCKELKDPKVAIRAGARSLHYWKIRRNKRTYRTTLACYNAGELCGSTGYADTILRWSQRIHGLLRKDSDQGS